jgi:glycosyltransferase involved in cell wall biosynthesis/predicted metal-dependent phosphoesterase TrpH
MKIDLHVHSRYSIGPNEWILKQLGSKESYTEPRDVYRIAKARGMDAVTITDHDSIDGCLAISHLPDVFISCEYTVRFPEDRIPAHVLCYNITAQQHQRLRRLQHNVFDMAQYLKEERIVHALAHPFFAPRDAMSARHLWELFNLFDTFEISGAKDAYVNDRLKKVLDALRPGHKLTGGSDDHSSLNIGRMYTEVPGAKNVQEFFEGVTAGRSEPKGESANPLFMAWTFCSLGWQWLKANGGAPGGSRVLDEFLLPPERRPEQTAQSRAKAMLSSVKPSNWRSAAALMFIGRETEKACNNGLRELPAHEQWFHIVESITAKYVTKLGTKLVDDIMHQRFFNVLSNAPLPLALHLLTVPYFVAYAAAAKQEKLAREFYELAMPPNAEKVKVGKFTDTFGSVDGVSKTLEEQLTEAMKAGYDYQILNCVDSRDIPGLKYFKPLGIMAAPEYEVQKLCVPPILHMLRYTYEQRFTHLQVATPGPVGLVGILAAKVLGLPLQAVYHTQVPEFIGKATDKSILEPIARGFCLWFYDRADVVFGPSQSTVDYLLDGGLSPNKVKVYPRGIDTDRFHPSKRTDYWERVRGVPQGNLKALFVGRVSKEKGLPLLASAFKKLTAEQSAAADGEHRAVTLMVVGEGGYLDEMRQELADFPAVFTGPLHGEELTEAFASADFFVFPSTTDTFGRVVLEAMASGIPAVVTDVGGPPETVTHGETGLIYRADDESALLEAMIRMVRSEDLTVMSKQAREYAETRSFAKAFEDFWNMSISENHRPTPDPCLPL